MSCYLLTLLVNGRVVLSWLVQLWLSSVSFTDFPLRIGVFFLAFGILYLLRLPCVGGLATSTSLLAMVASELFSIFVRPTILSRRGVPQSAVKPGSNGQAGVRRSEIEVHALCTLSYPSQINLVHHVIVLSGLSSDYLLVASNSIVTGLLDFASFDSSAIEVIFVSLSSLYLLLILSSFWCRHFLLVLSSTTSVLLTYNLIGSILMV